MVAAGWVLATPSDGASFFDVRYGRPCRIDHAFVSRHFTVLGSQFVSEFGGRSFIGITRSHLSDHAILLIDIELTSSPLGLVDSCGDRTS